MDQLAQKALSIASEISSVENRERKKTASAQRHFEHAIECLVKDLWLGTVIHPEYEVGIHRRSNWYSETPQYRDPNLTYKQAIAAYDGMVAAGHITVSLLLHNVIWSAMRVIAKLLLSPLTFLIL